MQTFLSVLIWFLALLPTALTIAAILYINIASWLDERETLRQIRQAVKDGKLKIYDERSERQP
jgi:hypothetical protein